MVGEATQVRLDQITKTYGGVAALTRVTFSANGGSIHAILGENGAGKSTLMKVLAGVVTPDSGLLSINENSVRIASPIEASRHGIVCIFQELSVIPHLTAAENIFLTDPPLTRFGFIDELQQRRRALEILKIMGCEDRIDLNSKCGDLPLSQKQIVEIAKALARKPRILILDEATSALTAEDVERIVKLLRILRDQGMCILFISHRMQEIEALADTISVFRNGQLIETFPRGAKTQQQIVGLMIGKEITQVYPAKTTSPLRGKPYLQARDLHWNQVLRGISLSVMPGEIVGLGGLDGQGQKEVVLALTGVLNGVTGEIEINGKSVDPKGPADGKKPALGLAMVPEDRKTEGLFLPLSVGENLTATIVDDLRSGLVFDRKQERSTIDELISRLRIKTINASVPVSSLSGGNQQKVVIAKWLATSPRLLLLLDPTRGIDVGTKQEIYRLFRDLASQGMAILFYSTDYDELVGLCDRALIMYGGRIVAELAGPDLTDHNVLSHALNVMELPPEKPHPGETRLAMESTP